MCVNILHFDPNQYALFNPIMLLRHDLSMLHLLGLIAIKTSVFLSQALSLSFLLGKVVHLSWYSVTFTKLTIFLTKMSPCGSFDVRVVSRKNWEREYVNCCTSYVTCSSSVSLCFLLYSGYKREALPLLPNK